ncbi:MAG: hypothetical protein ACMG50_00360 [Thermomonas sp.]
MQANRNQAPQSFAVIAPPNYATAFLVLAGGVLPFLIIVGLLWFRHIDSAGLIQFLPPVVIVALVLGLSLIAMRRRSVALVGNVLEVRAALFRQRTLIAEIDLTRAKLVDLAERTELSPFIKTMGMSMPGFHAGRFRLRGKIAKAFCLITDRHRVLWLPLHNGKDQLLLSVERPQALLDALQAAMDRQHKQRP